MASFVAAFPIDQPRYVVLVTLDEPKGDDETFGQAQGGWTAAPTVGADHQPDRPPARPAAGRSGRRDLVPRAAGRGPGVQRPHRPDRAQLRRRSRGRAGARRQPGRAGMRLSDLLDPGVTLQRRARRRGRDQRAHGRFAHARAGHAVRGARRQPHRRPPLRRRRDRPGRGRGAGRSGLRRGRPRRAAGASIPSRAAASR